MHYASIPIHSGKVLSLKKVSTLSFEAGLCRGTAFGLACMTRNLDLLEERDAIALLPKPVDALGRDVGIHNDAGRVSWAPTTTTRNLFRSSDR